ncbi:MAG: hypothetical protein AVDCRST_MAG14-2033 [uncultured Rubrobacteraceae bacterium]|uniref:Uncharacterized protein n=1 Tax=uncultured Rubrobacteraceae bacterium TaxID=349277 RepID=A0A6J4R460_9ACTN|nr:MAG: hypothetical protein AVDCRST_MAG14-2033 [uncultured Rubrobacteraceae bacterium]
MGKTINKTKHHRRRIPDTEAAIATRVAGGAAFGATVGAIGGVPGAVIGGLAGAAVLVVAPYLAVLGHDQGDDNDHNSN